MTKDKNEWKNWTERDKHFFDIGKLSQRKEDVEMFEKMIDEWSKEQITRPSPLTFDIKELKQKIKEWK